MKSPLQRIKEMTEGTRSYLAGCHHFFFHPLFVLIAWVKIYRSWPKGWELVCIFLHDIGHIGTNYLTYHSEKKKHWRLGAYIAYRMFGRKGFKMVAGHTGSSGFPRSKLYLPDKHSWLEAWKWWLESNRIFEPQLRCVSVATFQEMIQKNIDGGCKRGNHDIYLEYSQNGQE